MPQSTQILLLGWESVKFQKYIDLLYGSSLPKGKRISGKVPVYGSNGITDYHNEYLVEGPGIVVGRKGSIGQVRWIKNNFWPIDTTYYVTNKNNVNLRWLYYELQVLGLHKMNTASGIPGLNRNEVYSLNISIPPLPEQTRIAAILSKVDEEIEKTEQIIDETEKLKKGMMQDLLTKGIGHKKFKKTELGEVPEEWEVAAVGSICKCIVPGRNKPKVFSGNIPWITIPNLKDNTIIVDKTTPHVSKDEIINCGNKIIPINSVIMSCVGDFGKIAIIKQEIVVNQQLHAFLPSKELIPEFLKYALLIQKSYMETIATKTAVPYLNKTNCNSIPIVKPSLTEQTQIAQILISIDNKISINQKIKSHLEKLKKGLMQDLLSGKVRV